MTTQVQSVEVSIIPRQTGGEDVQLTKGEASAIVPRCSDGSIRPTRSQMKHLGLDREALAVINKRLSFEGTDCL